MSKSIPIVNKMFPKSSYKRINASVSKHYPTLEEMAKSSSIEEMRIKGDLSGLKPDHNDWITLFLISSLYQATCPGNVEEYGVWKSICRDIIDGEFFDKIVTMPTFLQSFLRILHTLMSANVDPLIMVYMFIILHLMLDRYPDIRKMSALRRYRQYFEYSDDIWKSNEKCVKL